MSQRTAFILICLAITINDFSNCCTDSELAHGCRVEKSDITASLECLCGVGCKKEFPYKSRTECEAALKSRRESESRVIPRGEHWKAYFTSLTKLATYLPT